MIQGYFSRIGFFLLAFFFWSIALCAPALSQFVQLPQTGQTHCYNTVPAEIACAGTGQDGDIRAGVPWPDPRFTSGTGAEADCMIDNLTGLMWPKNGNLPGARLAWTDAIDYANSLDLCGHSDWHLPNRNELESLVNADVPIIGIWLNGQGFSNVSGSTYWSSSTYVLDKVSKWYVNFVNGHVNWSGQAVFAWYVWPVRATTFSPTPIWQTGQTQCYDSASGVAIACAGTGQDGDIRAGVPWPIPRFSDHGDGTVTDNLTGLMWTENANAPGPSTCSPGTGKPWQSALDYVACLNTHTYLGYTDWHLPNRKELFSLIDLSNFNPALPTGHPFQNVHPNDRYWSSTTDPGQATYAWFVFMWDGLVSTDPKDIIHPYYVWPVRGRISVFSDVPAGYWAEAYIDAIYSAHITVGCSQNPLKYCPQDYVPREQMAAFLVRAVEGEPPLNYCDSISPFTDVTPDMWSCGYIKRLKELGITKGYGDGRYGPYDFVPRDQMAAFLVRAVEGEPPDNYCDSGVPFTDVAPVGLCKYIKRLKELGITKGYGDGRYGPSDFVPRDQMAAFLARAFLGMQ
jgi:hypothetical protein